MGSPGGLSKRGPQHGRGRGAAGRTSHGEPGVAPRPGECWSLPPYEAHGAVLVRRRVYRSSRLAGDSALRASVEGKLASHWSPEQVISFLLERCPEDSARWVCAKTIQRMVYRPDLGSLSRELPGHVLRCRRCHRVPRHST